MFNVDDRVRWKEHGGEGRGDGIVIEILTDPRLVDPEVAPLFRLRLADGRMAVAYEDEIVFDTEKGT